MINTRQQHDYWEPARRGFITNYPNFMHWKRLSPQEVSSGGDLNLYVHSPYCIQRCAYCYYKTVNLRGAEKQERMTAYVDSLCRELELAARTFGLSSRPVKTVYFGGGTPTLLPDDQLLRINEVLRTHYRLDGDTEYTVEAEPVTLTRAKMQTVLQMGATRVSLGVQSFDAGIIQASNRLDDEKKALRAVHVALESGLVVNVDLMSGLVGETDATWAHSMRTAIQTGVQSITVYKTEVYANTAYYRGQKDQTLQVPSEEDELRYITYALDQLAAADYQPWSFYTFTRGGRYVHQHSPRVFLGQDIYAFGTSAFGRLGSWLIQNSNEEERYAQLLAAGELPINRGHALTTLDSMVRDVVLGMKLSAFDLKAFRQRHGIHLPAMCPDASRVLSEGGFITLTTDRLTLTRRGLCYGDYVGKCFAREMRALGDPTSAVDPSVTAASLPAAVAPEVC